MSGRRGKGGRRERRPRLMARAKRKEVEEAEADRAGGWAESRGRAPERHDSTGTADRMRQSARRSAAPANVAWRGVGKSKAAHSTQHTAHSAGWPVALAGTGGSASHL